MTDDKRAPRDEYENTLRLLLSTLGVLSAPAQRQCSIMGNYNVGWELQHDGLDFLDYFLQLQPQQFDSLQIDALRSVHGALGRLPPLAIEPGVDARTVEGCLASMQHSAWNEVRALASTALQRLEGPAELNRDYFESKAPARRL
jgi:hypothetical protein